jgi:hypothetical protein
MPPLGLAYAAIVLFGYDGWLKATSNKKHRERPLHLILMLGLLAQEAVLLLAVVLF